MIIQKHFSANFSKYITIIIRIAQGMSYECHGAPQFAD